MDARENNEAINTALSKIGGFDMGNSPYWTSSQVDASSAWKCSTSDYTFGREYKSLTLPVRPVCSI